MEQIIVTRQDASTYVIGSTLPAVVITKAEQSCTLMGEDVVSISIEASVVIDFQIGDSITVYGRKYKLWNLPDVEKIGSNGFRYSVTFLGPVHDLEMTLFKLISTTGTSGSSDFSFMGDLEKFAEMLISNAGASWMKGSIAETTAKNLTFSNENCLNVLSRISEEFSCEYSIDFVSDQCVLNIDTKIGRDLPDIFQYGKTGGLISIKRKTVNSESLVTKLYGFGSTKNLPTAYRDFSTRLKLPLTAPTDFEAPTAPNNPSLLFLGGYEFRLSWEASTDNVAVVGYQVYLSLNGESFSLHDTVTTLYKDFNFNYLYGIPEARFKVYAVDANNNRSRASNTVYLSPTTVNLDAPVLISLVQLFPGLKLSWIKPAQLYDNIEIFRHTGELDNNTDYQLVATLGDSESEYSDIDVTIGERYFYYARSKRSGYYFSSPSNVLDATVITD